MLTTVIRSSVVDILSAEVLTLRENECFPPAPASLAGRSHNRHLYTISGLSLRRTPTRDPRNVEGQHYIGDHAHCGGGACAFETHDGQDGGCDGRNGVGLLCALRVDTRWYEPPRARRHDHTRFHGSPLRSRIARYAMSAWLSGPHAERNDTSPIGPDGRIGGSCP